MALVYEFSNAGVATNARGYGPTATSDGEGLCFGYSTIWCVNMQKHPDKPLLTKPDKFGAALLQQRVEMMRGGWTNNVKKLVALNGHGAGPEQALNWSLVARTIAVGDGHYIIDIGDHWVAASVAGGGYAFFDANEGMTTFDTVDDFVAGVKARLKVYKDDTDPDNGWEDQHKIYSITN